MVVAIVVVWLVDNKNSRRELFGDKEDVIFLNWNNGPQFIKLYNIKNGYFIF